MSGAEVVMEMKAAGLSDRQIQYILRLAACGYSVVCEYGTVRVSRIPNVTDIPPTELPLISWQAAIAAC